ncbi:uncharacterized protein BDR25DRAFT_101840 [Lindgomyces ingoldianus]|uniref:Uncharacterized protein n=1 Tax=Lindgomyces ingoldianus TaxID=673940 RepID=A0ACB6RAH4_9PLEO|nr:uncharacterized protein BDR25DRAFT_101840 [Lindgomyces ingoldianus]KAF2475327.1 hypothetical protein BDR25DRAFT_101840 [Lindgomyces ingoldianus]
MTVHGQRQQRQAADRSRIKPPSKRSLSSGSALLLRGEWLGARSKIAGRMNGVKGSALLHRHTTACRLPPRHHDMQPVTPRAKGQRHGTCPSWRAHPDDVKVRRVSHRVRLNVEMQRCGRGSAVGTRLAEACDGCPCRQFWTFVPDCCTPRACGARWSGDLKAIGGAAIMIE